MRQSAHPCRRGWKYMIHHPIRNAAHAPARLCSCWRNIPTKRMSELSRRMEGSDLRPRCARWSTTDRDLELIQQWNQEGRGLYGSLSNNGRQQRRQHCLWHRLCSSNGMTSQSSWQINAWEELGLLATDLPGSDQVVSQSIATGGQSSSVRCEHLVAGSFKSGV